MSLCEACEGVRALMREFVLGRLSSEKRGRVIGHLMNCGGCCLFYEEQLNEAFEKGELRPADPTKSLEEALEQMSLRRKTNRLNWDEIKESVRQGARWARRYWTEVLRQIRECVRVWQEVPWPVEAQARGVSAQTRASAISLLDAEGKCVGRLRVVPGGYPCFADDGSFSASFEVVEREKDFEKISLSILIGRGTVVRLSGKVERQSGALLLHFEGTGFEGVTACKVPLNAIEVNADM